MNWIIFTPLAITIVEESTAERARQKFLDDMGYGTKPYLARDWVVRQPTEDELRFYAAQADARGGSKTTAASVKNPPPKTGKRLGLFDG